MEKHHNYNFKVAAHNFEKFWLMRKIPGRLQEQYRFGAAPLRIKVSASGLQRKRKKGSELGKHEVKVSYTVGMCKEVVKQKHGKGRHQILENQECQTK